MVASMLRVADLKAFAKKVVSLEDLARVIPGDYPEFAAQILSAVQSGFLKPVAKSGSNRRIPCLFKRYHVVLPEEDYSAVFRELDWLHPALDGSYYHRHPAAFEKDARAVRALSEFLYHHEEDLRHEVALNERSYQVFHDEKALRENVQVQTVLKNLSFDMKRLGVFATPEPFMYFSRGPMTNPLIVENKDTWHSLRRLMREGKTAFFGAEVDTLIYGEGRKVVRSFAFVEDVPQLAGCPTFLYCGDLDYEGIEIYQALCRAYPTYRFEAFVPFYLAMLDHTGPLGPRTLERRQRATNITPFISQFPEADQLRVKQLLHAGQYIPQEAVSFTVLKES